ncbi:MAG: HAMP domain-containing sensor histidine kinase [Micrococcaceae bacterium]
MKIEKWKSWSLRAQLLTITSGLLIISLVATGIGTVLILKNSLMVRVDNELTDNSRQLVNNVIRDSQTHSDATIQTLPSNYAILIYDNGGNFKGYFISDINYLDHPDPSSILQTNLNNLRGKTFDMDGTEKNSWGWRATVVQVPGSYNTYVVAQKLDMVKSLINQSLFAIFGVSILVIFIAVTSAYLLVTRSFKPLEEIEDTAREISKGNYSKRLEFEDHPAQEIQQLSNVINKMLDNIESSFEVRKESEEKMRQFVGDASHELRTPLTTIIGFSELYQKGWLKDDEQLSEAMGRIQSESARMKVLVEDLLDLTRLDEERVYKQEYVDLRDLIADAMSDSRASHPERKIHLASLAGGAPKSTIVVGDNQRLQQVLINLLTNAIRYTPEETPIELITDKEEVNGVTKAVMEVRDHGPGIPEQEKTKIFGRFYRTDTSRSREQGGNGLGLAIVMAIVKKHDGKIEILDTPGGGATFKVTFPIKEEPKKITPTDNAREEKQSTKTQTA